MKAALIIIPLIVTAVFFLYQLVRYGTAKNNKTHLLTGGDENVPTNELPQDELWWALLDTRLQLELAVALACKVLPLWQKYCEANQLVYRNSANGPFIKINPLLLQRSLDEIARNSSPDFTGGNKNIISCRNEFVAPLIALQDGNWTVTYPVKKLFLAVYNILKGMAAQDDIAATKSLFALSIKQSLDCLDMCKLYSQKDITSFLYTYKIAPTN